jgi:hypothetical protein
MAFCAVVRRTCWLGQRLAWRIGSADHPKCKLVERTDNYDLFDIIQIFHVLYGYV